MTTPKQTFLLTDTGIHETTTDFSSFASTGITGDINLGCVTNDIRLPMFWYGNSDLLTWRIFDPITGLPKTYTSVAAYKYIRAVQFDQMINQAFFLTAFRDDSVFSNANGIITRYNPATQIESEFVIKIKGVTTSIFYALDIKVDPSRRNIWILDAGNNRILRCNVDTGEVNRIFSPSKMVAPCSMTIDLSSGDAYIRCLNSTADGDSESSSSSSISSSDQLFLETIYKANDDGITPIVETNSTIQYDNKWLSPSLSDIEDIISTGDPIPLPASDSMKFDQLRGKLWWISKSSESIVFVVDVNTLVMNSISLLPSLDSISTINLDRDSGNAIVCGSYGSSGRIVVVDQTFFTYTTYLCHDCSSINNIIVMEPEFGNCLPFYVTGYAEQTNTESSSSETSNPVNVCTINNALIAEEETASTITTHTPYIDVRVWGAESSGISSTKVWTSKNRPSPDRFVENAFYTPLFSWSSIVKAGKPVIAIATENGDLLKIQLDIEQSSILEIGKCSQPVDGAIIGLSVSNGNSNVYVSGQGSIARINFDPTTVEADTEESSSSSSSQSDENMNSNNLLVSQKITDTGIGGLSVQFHTISNEIFSVSGQDCTLISSKGLDGWEAKATYGPVPNPFKAIWSKQHNGVVMAGKYSVHLVKIPTGTIQVTYGVPDYQISDICVKNGKIGIAVSSFDGENGLFKVLDANLVSNLLFYKSSGESPSGSCFMSDTTVLIALDNYEANSTRFVSANFSGLVQESSISIEGQIKSLFFDENFDIAIAVFSSGKIISIRLDDSKIPIITTLGDLNQEISFAGGSLLSNQEDKISTQKKIRVFVGSSNGTNDRWDSGEIETESQEVLYGGGDNLSPGEAYWLSISIMDETYGWSEPTSRLFTVPIM